MSSMTSIAQYRHSLYPSSTGSKCLRDHHHEVLPRYHGLYRGSCCSCKDLCSDHKTRHRRPEDSEKYFWLTFHPTIYLTPSTLLLSLPSSHSNRVSSPICSPSHREVPPWEPLFSQSLRQTQRACDIQVHLMMTFNISSTNPLYSGPP